VGVLTGQGCLHPVTKVCYHGDMTTTAKPKELTGVYPDKTTAKTVYWVAIWRSAGRFDHVRLPLPVATTTRDEAMAYAVANPDTPAFDAWLAERARGVH
jgi:hypothetical protein